MKTPHTDQSSEGLRRGRPRPAAAVVAERLLATIGIVCLGYYGYVSVEAFLYQRYENQALNAILASAPPSAGTAAAASPGAGRRPAPGSTMGRIEIPRLNVSAIVRAGIDARTLGLAVGHVPGTALPGERGNAGLAGHRDTFFRRLDDIRPDDEIRVVTPGGTYVYRVERTDVVQPADIWVLEDTPTPVLTLVTCYPFTFVGSAPERFVVRARLVEPASLAAASPPVR
jgi:sortase A